MASEQIAGIEKAGRGCRFLRTEVRTQEQAKGLPEGRDLPTGFTNT